MPDPGRIDPPDWVRDAVFYQIVPDRFARSGRVPAPGPLEAWDTAPSTFGFKGGDLPGIVEHLDHIAHLGANALYLTPVFQSAANHRYHTYDYLAVDPLLGGDAALRELLDAAHGRGIRVILDGVFNHTGRGFWAFHHVLENGKASPYRNWFVIDQAALDEDRPMDAYPGAADRTPGAGRGPDGGPWRGDSLAELGYRGWWDLPPLPKLNIAESAVREHLWAVAEHWLRFGIDGWRLDVPGEIQDPPFWAEFRRRCRAVNPEAYLVGEVWDVDPAWVSGNRFDGLMNYPLAEAIYGFVGGSALDEELIGSHHEYAKAERLDGPGFAARLAALLEAYAPATRFAQLNLLDSHDTPRLGSLLRDDEPAVELAVLLQATLPGAPCIYYGDEIGLGGGLDPDNRRAFPWDQRADWNESRRAFITAALALRQREPLLRRGELRVVAAEAGWLAFDRTLEAGSERLRIVVNAGEESAAVPLLDGPTSPSRIELLELPSSRAELQVEVSGASELRVPPRSGAILRLRP